MIKLCAFFLMAILISLPGAANEIYEDWITARAAGMGNAFSAVVDDYNALLYNPAGLDKIHGFHLTLLTPELGTDVQNAYQVYQDMTGSNFSQIIHNYYGQVVWAGISDSLGFSMHDFALIGYDNINMNFNLHNPAYPNITFGLTNDVGIAGGFAASLLPNDALRMGVAVKRITRYGGRVPIGPGTLATLSNTQLTQMISNYGTGYGLDAGMLIELPGPMHFTLSAAWHNIGQTQFTLIGGTTTPPPMDNDPTLGFSMTFDTFAFKFVPTFEYDHINLSQSEQLGKLMHFGGELQFIGGLAIRGGAYQGYYTAGVGFDLKFIRVDAATYGVELDTYPGQLEDRRYILQFTMDLNMDPSFDFFSGHGRRGKSGGGGGGGGGGGSDGTGTNDVSPGYQRR